MVVVNTVLVGIEVDFAIEVLAWDRLGTSPQSCLDS